MPVPVPVLPQRPLLAPRSAAAMYLCRAASQALAARLSRAPSAAGRLQHRGTDGGCGGHGTGWGGTGQVRRALGPLVRGPLAAPPPEGGGGWCSSQPRFMGAAVAVCAERVV